MDEPTSVVQGHPQLKVKVISSRSFYNLYKASEREPQGQGQGKGQGRGQGQVKDMSMNLHYSPKNAVGPNDRGITRRQHITNSGIGPEEKVEGDKTKVDSDMRSVDRVRSQGDTHDVMEVDGDGSDVTKPEVEVAEQEVSVDSPSETVSTSVGRGRNYQRHNKPPHSYITLIAMAIRDSPTGRVTLAQINDYLRARWTFFRGPYTGWRNSVRHNLSLNECFVKVLRDPARPWGKDNYWTINPHSEYVFLDGSFRRRRRRLARRPHAQNRGDLSSLPVSSVSSTSVGEESADVCCRSMGMGLSDPRFPGGVRDLKLSRGLRDFQSFPSGFHQSFQNHNPFTIQNIFHHQPTSMTRDEAKTSKGKSLKERDEMAAPLCVERAHRFSSSFTIDNLLAPGQADDVTSNSGKPQRLSTSSQAMLYPPCLPLTPFLSPYFLPPGYRPLTPCWPIMPHLPTMHHYRLPVGLTTRATPSGECEKEDCICKGK